MIIYPQLDPIALDLGLVKVHWYGIMYGLSFLFGYLFALSRISKGSFPLSRQQLVDFVGWVAIGVILGGRMGYMFFYQLFTFLDNPLSVFFIWQGGMSFHGGLIGVISATWWFAKKQNIHPLILGDSLAPLIPIGLFFGRLGNFIGGELWGRPTDLPWGMVFQHVDTFAMILEGLVLFGVLFWYSSSIRVAGQVTGLFLVGYGVFRFLIEFFREPDRHLGFLLFDWMTMGHLLTLPMIVGGSVLFFFVLVQKKGENNEGLS